RHIALGILCLLRCRTDSVEPDVCEKHYPSALHHAAPAEMPARAGAGRDERMPVSGIDAVSRTDDEEQHHCYFYKHNDVIDIGGFANADYEQQGDNTDDDDRWQIEDRRDLRSICQSNKRPARRRQLSRNVNADVPQKRYHVARPTDGNSD